MDLEIVAETRPRKKWVIRNKESQRERDKNRSRAEKRAKLLRETGFEELPEGMKQCRQCLKAKPFSEFYSIKYVYKPGQSGFRSRCIECEKVESKRERQNASTREWHRNYRLLSRFGITAKQYDEMFASQNGRCAICMREDKRQRLAVDHDHKTGRVRGLLCLHCNVAIGKLDDDAEIVRRAFFYLLQHSGGDC